MRLSINQSLSGIHRPGAPQTDRNSVARERIEAGRPALHFGRYLDPLPPKDDDSKWEDNEQYDRVPKGWKMDADGDMYDPSRTYINEIGDRGPIDPTDPFYDIDPWPTTPYTPTGSGEG